MVTEETLRSCSAPRSRSAIQGLSALVDNIILLEYMDVGSGAEATALGRSRQRGAGHDANVRELCITEQGHRAVAPMRTSAQRDPDRAYRSGRDPRRPRGT